jgi:hypothetical protein
VDQTKTFLTGGERYENCRFHSRLIEWDMFVLHLIASNYCH